MKQDFTNCEYFVKLMARMAGKTGFLVREVVRIETDM